MDDGMYRFFITCLITARYEDGWWQMKKGKSARIGVRVKRGQFIFGRHSWGKKLNCSPDTARKRLKRLIDAGMLTAENRKSFTVVTIVNWDKYQTHAMENYKEAKEVHDNLNRESNQQPTADSVHLRTTSGPPADHKQESKESKERKEKNRATRCSSEKKTELRGTNLENFDKFWDAFGLKKNKLRAKASFPEAVKKASVEVINAGALRECSNREIRRLKGIKQVPIHAHTWLDNQRWEDEHEESIGNPQELDMRPVGLKN